MRICDLCGATSYEVICRQDRRGKPWNTVACTHCGLVGHERVPSEDELRKFYASSYRMEYHGEKEPSNRRVWRAWLKGERLLGSLRSYLKPTDRLFEVGAGLGCTVKVFQLAGYDASGLEPGTDFQHYSASKLRARIEHGEIFSHPITKQFDLVLLVHVIEHFRSPSQALQVIHRMIAPGGHLYLECPSLGTEHADLAELFHFAHIHTFTPITLLTMLRRAGFVVAQAFSEGRGENHKYLLRKVEPTNVPIDPQGIAQTREFLTTYHRPWHRLRIDYFARRAHRIRLYLREFLWGKTAVNQILHRCAAA